MTKSFTLRHQFVERIPDELEEETVYVSIPFATAAHKCCCGCGNEVVTPFTPTDWMLLFDGETISISPSIGNWSFECRSHYWIKRNQVKWSKNWSQTDVEAGRARDTSDKQRHFDTASNSSRDRSSEELEKPGRVKPLKNFWQRLTGWFK